MFVYYTFMFFSKCISIANDFLPIFEFCVIANNRTWLFIQFYKFFVISIHCEETIYEKKLFISIQ